MELPKIVEHGLNVYEIIEPQGVNGSPKKYGKYLVIKMWVRLIDSPQGIRIRDRIPKTELIAINETTGDTFLLMPMALGRGTNHVNWTEKRISAYKSGVYYAHELMEIFGKDT